MQTRKNPRRNTNKVEEEKVAFNLDDFIKPSKQISSSSKKIKKQAQHMAKKIVSNGRAP
jgi:hypothetical protein